MKTLLFLILITSTNSYSEIGRYELTAVGPDKVKSEKSTSSTSESSGMSGLFLLCKDNTQSVRTLRMIKKNSGHCITTYSKQGIDKTQIQSKKESDCLEVLQNIRANLEKGNWKCKEVSGLRISGNH